MIGSRLDAETVSRRRRAVLPKEQPDSMQTVEGGARLRRVHPVVDRGDEPSSSRSCTARICRRTSSTDAGGSWCGRIPGHRAADRHAARTSATPPPRRTSTTTRRSTTTTRCRTCSFSRSTTTSRAKSCTRIRTRPITTATRRSATSCKSILAPGATRRLAPAHARHHRLGSLGAGDGALLRSAHAVPAGAEQGTQVHVAGSMSGVPV